MSISVDKLPPHLYNLLPKHWHVLPIPLLAALLCFSSCARQGGAGDISTISPQTISPTETATPTSLATQVPEISTATSTPTPFNTVQPTQTFTPEPTPIPDVDGPYIHGSNFDLQQSFAKIFETGVSGESYLEFQQRVLATFHIWFQQVASSAIQPDDEVGRYPLQHPYVNPLNTSRTQDGLGLGLGTRALGVFTNLSSLYANEQQSAQYSEQDSDQSSPHLPDYLATNKLGPTLNTFNGSPTIPVAFLRSSLSDNTPVTLLVSMVAVREYGSPIELSNLAYAFANRRAGSNATRGEIDRIAREILETFGQQNAEVYTLFRESGVWRVELNWACTVERVMDAQILGDGFDFDKHTTSNMVKILQDLQPNYRTDQATLNGSDPGVVFLIEVRNTDNEPIGYEIRALVNDSRQQILSTNSEVGSMILPCEHGAGPTETLSPTATATAVKPNRTSTPTPKWTSTPSYPTQTPQPTSTPQPESSRTPEPQPTVTPQPTNEPAPTYTPNSLPTQAPTNQPEPTPEHTRASEETPIVPEYTPTPPVATPTPIGHSDRSQVFNLGGFKDQKEGLQRWEEKRLESIVRATRRARSAFGEIGVEIVTILAQDPDFADQDSASQDRMVMLEYAHWIQLNAAILSSTTDRSITDLPINPETMTQLGLSLPTTNRLQRSDMNTIPTLEGYTQS